MGVWNGDFRKTAGLLRRQSGAITSQSGPKPPAKRRSAPSAGGGSPRQRVLKASAKKKITMASLAESLDQITQALPALSNQLHHLTQRTAAIEAGSMRGPDRASALRRPLSSFTTDGSRSPSNLGCLLKTMPPPRSTAPQAAPRVSFGPPEMAKIAEDLGGEQSD